MVRLQNSEICAQLFWEMDFQNRNFHTVALRLHLCKTEIWGQIFWELTSIFWNSSAVQFPIFTPQIGTLKCRKTAHYYRILETIPPSYFPVISLFGTSMPVKTNCIPQNWITSENICTLIPFPSFDGFNIPELSLHWKLTDVRPSYLRLGFIYY